MKKLILLLISLAFFALPGFSQRKLKTTETKANSEGHCATDQLHISLNEQSTSYKRKFEDMNANWQKWATEKNNGNKLNGSNSTQAYQQTTLPVIFHMMLNSTTSPNPAASATDNNLTKAQVQTALATLNQLFAGTATGSKATGLNTDIQFCLAEVDNYGNAITSYTCTDPSFSLSLNNTNQPQITALSNIVQSTGKFPTTKYINIYVVDDIAGSVAGFAYMPPAHGSSFDGIYVEAQWLLTPSGPNDLPYNMTVLTHEMGHYLGLFHTFGICTNIFYACSCNNNNCLFDGDMVCDTPPDFSQSTTVGGCMTPTNTCNTDVAATGDMLNLTADMPDLTDNYMDYGDWNCQHMFTQGQVKRMHFMIDNMVGPRNSLLNSSVCNTVCANPGCTVTINPITTTTVNSVQLLNSLILSGPSVAFNFTGNTCGTFYNTFNWTSINLTSNTVIQTGTSAGFNAAFTAIGNYRIILMSSIAGSSPLCFQSDTLDIQVLPPVNCPNNLDMTGGWNTGNWQRIQYEGGWSHTTNNSITFTHPTTTLTMVPGFNPNGTAFTDPFSFTTTLTGDPNFSTVALPSGVSTIMRVGRLITPTTTLPAGDGNYVTYTFSPTSANAKLRVYYLGLKEHDVVSPTAYDNTFASNGGAKSGFGFVCSYDFKSISNPPNLGHRGLTHTGNNYTYFRQNDMVTDVINSPITSPVTIGSSTFDKMSGWNFLDLDFTEFISASPTITVTFFARSDEASTPGILHSYAYFAAQCLPGNFKNVDLHLPNRDIACMADVGQSCVKEFLPPPNGLSAYINSYYYGDIFDVDVEESNDNITYTSTFLGYGLQYNSTTNQYDPFLNLCKTADTFPYKYYRIIYKTLCDTVIDTVSIFQGFVHTINDCSPNSMSGGHFINPPVVMGTNTISPDQYVQYCTTTTLSLQRPCWLAPTDPDPEYQWEIGSSWSSIAGATLATLAVSDLNVCRPYRRQAKYHDPYCNTDIWIPSDIFTLTSYQLNYFNSMPTGPDICGNSLATFSINNIYEYYNIPACDLEIAAQTATAPVTNSISFAFFSNSSCSASSSLTANSGPSVLSYTYNNSITYTSSINLSYTFNNAGIYTSNGFIYTLATVTRFGCTSTFTITVPIKIKPSAIAGTITPQTGLCTNTTYSVNGDNANSTGYYWEYSYNSAFSPAYTVPSATSFSLPVAPGTFTAYPVYLRRAANGTVVCPLPAFSNTLVINNTAPSITISPSSSTICAGGSETLIATGASTVTWNYGTGTSTINPLVTTPTVSTIYTVTSTSSVGCTDTKTVSITVNPSPLLKFVSTYTICLGSCVTVTLNGGTSYTITGPSYTSNSNPVTFCPTVNTTYTVVAQNASGCTATRTIAVTVIPSATVTVSSSSGTICAGTGATLTASGASSYTWTYASGSSTLNPFVISPTVTTTYTLTGSNSPGCSNTKTISVTVNPVPVLTGVASATICKGSGVSYTAGGASSYTWTASSYTSYVNPATLSPTVTTTYTLTGQNAYGCISTKTIVITVLPVPSVTATASNYTICSGQSTTLTASGAVTYTWVSPPSSSTSINPLTVSPGVTSTYTVYGKPQGSGCAGSQTIMINVLSSPTVNIAGSTIICSGHCTTLTASGGGTYSWSAGPTTPSICASPGIQTLVVTGASGCITTKTINVTLGVSPSLTASATQYTICSGYSTTLSASGASTYTWTAPSFTSTINPVMVTPTVTTTYTLTGMQGDVGCKSTKTINIVVIPNPTVSILGNPIICGGCASLTATGGGTYSWSTGSTASVICISSPGVQTLTVTGTNGCTTVNTITVTIGSTPTIMVSASSTTICAGSNATLTAYSGSSYTWTAPAFTSNSNPVVVSPTVTTTYTVSGVKGNNTCTGTNTITIYVTASPTAFISGNTKGCGSYTTVLTAAGGGTYLWSTGATGSSIVYNATMTGVVSVTVTGTGGCQTVASTAVNVNPIPLASIGGSTVICSGSSTTLTASGGISYLWNIGATSAAISPTAGGVYNVTVTNGYNCSAVASVTVGVIPSPTVNITGGLSICPPGTTTLTATGGGSYLWNTGATTSTLLVNTTGVKTVTVTAANGCTAVRSVTVTSPIDCAKIGGGDVGRAYPSANIYPNPTRQSFNVGNAVNVMMVEVYDYTGKLLMQVSKTDNPEFKNIDIKEFVQGAYFIRVVNSDSESDLFKLIKE